MTIVDKGLQILPVIMLVILAIGLVWAALKYDKIQQNRIEVSDGLEERITTIEETQSVTLDTQNLIITSVALLVADTSEERKMQRNINIQFLDLVEHGHKINESVIKLLQAGPESCKGVSPLSENLD